MGLLAVGRAVGRLFPAGTNRLEGVGGPTEAGGVADRNPKEGAGGGLPVLLRPVLRPHSRATHPFRTRLVYTLFGCPPPPPSSHAFFGGRYQPQSYSAFMANPSPSLTQGIAHNPPSVSNAGDALLQPPPPPWPQGPGCTKEDRDPAP